MNSSEGLPLRPTGGRNTELPLHNDAPLSVSASLIAQAGRNREINEDKPPPLPPRMPIYPRIIIQQGMYVHGVLEV